MSLIRRGVARLLELILVVHYMRIELSRSISHTWPLGLLSRWPYVTVFPCRIYYGILANRDLVEIGHCL
jgi:hypothetical protein